MDVKGGAQGHQGGLRQMQEQDLHLGMPLPYPNHWAVLSEQARLPPAPTMKDAWGGGGPVVRLGEIWL